MKSFHTSKMKRMMSGVESELFGILFNKLNDSAHRSTNQLENIKMSQEAFFFVTDKDVKGLLQDSAREALQIKDKELLSKWTSHSLRVTAANNLHRLNFSEAFIKKCLHWRLDSYMIYLRNTIHVARAHTLGLSKTPIKVTTKEARKIQIF